MSDPEMEIESVCEVHQGSGRVVITCEGDRIVLDEHADHCRVITVEGTAVTLLFDVLGGVAGVSGRAWWVLCRTEGTAHLLAVEGTGFLTTQCRKSLPSGVLQLDRVPHHLLCRERAVTTVTTGIDPCPYCGGITGVQPVPGTSPRVQAWSCGECGTDWAISVVNPAQRHLDHLATRVELTAARRMLRQVIALADEAPALSDDQLQVRLVDLATVTDSRVACEAPAGHRLRDTPESPPGGQPVPDSPAGDVASPESTGVGAAR